MSVKYLSKFCFSNNDFKINQVAIECNTQDEFKNQVDIILMKANYSCLKIIPTCLDNINIKIKFKPIIIFSKINLIEFLANELKYAEKVILKHKRNQVVLSKRNEIIARSKSSLLKSSTPEILKLEKLETTASVFDKSTQTDQMIESDLLYQASLVHKKASIHKDICGVCKRCSMTSSCVKSLSESTLDDNHNASFHLPSSPFLKSLSLLQYKSKSLRPLDTDTLEPVSSFPVSPASRNSFIPLQTVQTVPVHNDNKSLGKVPSILDILEDHVSSLHSLNSCDEVTSLKKVHAQDLNSSLPNVKLNCQPNMVNKFKLDEELSSISNVSSSCSTIHTVSSKVKVNKQSFLNNYKNYTLPLLDVAVSGGNVSLPPPPSPPPFHMGHTGQSAMAGGETIGERRFGPAGGGNWRHIQCSASGTDDSLPGHGNALGRGWAYTNTNTTIEELTPKTNGNASMDIEENVMQKEDSSHGRLFNEAIQPLKVDNEAEVLWEFDYNSNCTIFESDAFLFSNARWRLSCDKFVNRFGSERYGIKISLLELLSQSLAVTTTEVVSRRNRSQSACGATHHPSTPPTGNQPDLVQSMPSSSSVTFCIEVRLHSSLRAPYSMRSEGAVTLPVAKGGGDRDWDSDCALGPLKSFAFANFIGSELLRFVENGKLKFTVILQTFV